MFIRLLLYIIFTFTIFLSFSCEKEEDNVFVDSLPTGSILSDYAYYHGIANEYDFFTVNTKTSQVISAFDSLVNKDPSFVHKINIGNSCENEQIDCYDFYSNDIKGKKKIIIICAQHGFEKSSSFGMFFFLRDLVFSHTEDLFLDFIYNSLRLIIIPVANPSGFDKIIYKNTKGVNLNRNWPVLNWSIIDDITSPYYSGQYPLDQPETKSFYDMVLANRDAVLFIDFHTNGMDPVKTSKQINWISMPINKENDKNQDLIKISQLYHDSMKKFFDDCYGTNHPSLLSDSQIGYITTGGLYSKIGFADVSIAQLGLHSLTFEGFNGFPGDAKPFNPDVEKANSELIGNYLLFICKYFISDN